MRGARPDMCMFACAVMQSFKVRICRIVILKLFCFKLLTALLISFQEVN